MQPKSSNMQYRKKFHFDHFFKTTLIHAGLIIQANRNKKFDSVNSFKKPIYEHAARENFILFIRAKTFVSFTLKRFFENKQNL